jgi:hypothetical protein
LGGILNNRLKGVFLLLKFRSNRFLKIRNSIIVNSLLFFLCFNRACAQDVIVLKDSTRYEGKILSTYETKNEVAFLFKTDNPDEKGGKRLLLSDISYIKKDGEVLYDLKNNFSTFKNEQPKEEKSEKKSRLFLTIGFGPGNFGDPNPYSGGGIRYYSRGIGLNYQYEKNLFTFHAVIVNDQKEILFPFDREAGPLQIGVLYGRIFCFKDIFLSGSLGLSHVAYKLGWESTRTLNTLNIPLELKIFYTPLENVGIGLIFLSSYIFENDNDEELPNYQGLMINLVFFQNFINATTH